MKKRTGRILWAAALALLAAVLVSVNLPDKKPSAGAAEGELLPDFAVTCLNGDTFRLSEQRGKTVVINIWATWCAPCVKELPHFDRLLRERPGEVAVLAVHAPPVTADVNEYLSAFTYVIPFAVDGTGTLNDTLDIRSVLPQTVIVSPDGIVTYNRSGALSYEELAALADKAA